MPRGNHRYRVWYHTNIDGRHSVMVAAKNRKAAGVIPGRHFDFPNDLWIEAANVELVR